MSENLILPIPPVPTEIVNAVNTKTLAVFVGAGVSRIIGCKGWDALAGDLIEKCSQMTKKDGSINLDYRAKEILSQYTDHKKAITICYEILRDNGCENDFFKVLEESFNNTKMLLNYLDIYDQIYKLRGLNITTNADRHFDRLFNIERIVYKEKDFNPANIDPTKLYHIHGSIQDRDSLVFTTPKYIERYRDPMFIEFLRGIFDRYTVLFVGYGMNEFELLDFVITKYGSAKEKEKKHVILLPFYTGEESRLKFESYYHEKMGISVIPYEKNKLGYGQLYEVIKEWNKKINLTSTFLYESYKEIEEMVDQYGR